MTLFLRYGHKFWVFQFLDAQNYQPHLKMLPKKMYILLGWQ